VEVTGELEAIEANPWRPTPIREDGTVLEVEARPDDHYVVVDEIIDEHVRLVASPWPLVDEDERLTFPEEGSILPSPFDLDDLQAYVDARRAGHGQVQRPLRIGDAFLVRGEVEVLEGWADVVDVTGPARQQAKHALLRAIAPPSPRRREEATRFLEMEPVPPKQATEPPARRRPGSVANPAV